MRTLAVSIGGTHNAKVKKTWRGTWEQFCKVLMAKVPETMDKAAAGWVCGAVFDPPYRDSENFVERNLLSLDYDHIAPDDIQRILQVYSGTTYLAYTTWSHTDGNPRCRVWLPLSRAVGYDEFQAISRSVANNAGIELAARESHVPAQYMFRPAVKPFEEIQTWVNEGPWVDVDKILGEYGDWTDRSLWPRRASGDGVHSEGASVDPRSKPGIIGAFCRAFTISEAIERFGLPYSPSSEGRYTYTAGSRPDGCIVYDEDTKLHSHHDTDPARGQSSAYDLVRLHRFGALDIEAKTAPLRERPSSRAMEKFARELAEVRTQLPRIECATEFEDLGPVESGLGGGPTGLPTLPATIVKPTSKLTDQENARRIQRRYGTRLISIGKSFYCWTGTHWQNDPDDSEAKKIVAWLGQIVGKEAEKARLELDALCIAEKRLSTKEEEAEVASIWRWSFDCGSRARRQACTDELRDFLAFNAMKLNLSKHLFSCANGTINLKTGELKAHDSKDFITSCSPIKFDPAAQAPRFQKFLREIYDGDEEVVAFAQRWFGYCLTGEVSEHKMVFHIGEGGNGKGTLMTLLLEILGFGYYGTANQNLLTYDGKGASPELAGLLGKRMVTISETEQNIELREGLLKHITGGDPIKARDLFKSYFDFLPTHKLQIFTNHEPAIKTQDFSIWRRIILLKYPHKWGNATQVALGAAEFLVEPGLDASLLAEAPGVLAWLVEGAKAWYKGGLQAPESVVKATIAYQSSQDLPAKFVSERITVDPEAFSPLSQDLGAILPVYQKWCATMGSRPLGRLRFEKEMLRVVKGSTLEHRKGLPGFKGFKLTQTDDLD